jgi:hypothetical protein
MTSPVDCSPFESIKPRVSKAVPSVGHAQMIVPGAEPLDIGPSLRGCMRTTAGSPLPVAGNRWRLARVTDH